MSQYDPNVNLATARSRIDARATEALDRRLRDVSRGREPTVVASSPTRVGIEERRTSSDEIRQGDESLVVSRR